MLAGMAEDAHFWSSSHSRVRSISRELQMSSARRRLEYRSCAHRYCVSSGSSAAESAQRRITVASAVQICLLLDPRALPAVLNCAPVALQQLSTATILFRKQRNLHRTRCASFASKQVAGRLTNAEVHACRRT